MARLIINADDFGLTKGVNRAIGELAHQRALTSATLMACGAAFSDAASIASNTPTLSVGCHIVLVDGLATAPPREISSLVLGNPPRFRTSLARFAASVQSGKIDPAHIETEATAQIRKLQSAGIHVTHVDTHKHTHLFPAVTGAVLRAAATCGIGAIRNPFEPHWCTRIGGGFIRQTEVALLRRFEHSFRAQSLIKSREIKTTDGSLGVSLTGTLDRKMLSKILNAIPEGTWELVTHPGYRDSALDQAGTRLLDSRETERTALLEVIKESKHDLISFADLS